MGETSQLSLKDAPVRPRPHALVTAPGLTWAAETSQLLPKTALEPPPLLAKPQHAFSPHHPPALLPSHKPALELPPLPAKPQHALSPPHHPALLPSLKTALEPPLLLASPQHALSPVAPALLPSLTDAPVRPRPTALETAPGTTVLAHEQ